VIGNGGFKNLRCAHCNDATSAYLFIDEEMDIDKLTFFTSRIYCADYKKRYE
jgi:hypothetical protein